MHTNLEISPPEDSFGKERRADTLPLPETDFDQRLFALSDLGGTATLKVVTPETLIDDHLESAPPLQEPAELPDALAALAEKTEKIGEDNFHTWWNPKTCEVEITSDLTLKDWEAITPPEDMALLKGWAEATKGELNGRSINFINPTDRGGGVAMMRPKIVHLLRELGIDAHWYRMKAPEVEKGEPNVFKFTKLVHNIIQRAPNTERITAAGKLMHKLWSNKSLKTLLKQPNIRDGVNILDDPQELHLVRPLKKAGSTVIWRNHIDNDKDLLEDPSTPQGEVWQYFIESGLLEADAFIFHPDIDGKFVPEKILDRTFLAPATIETLDLLNRDLAPEEVELGLQSANAEITEENEQFIKDGRFDDVHDLIDPERDRFFQIARHDESKNEDLMMDFGMLVRQKVIEKRRARGQGHKKPIQVGIVGNGSMDDPSGESIYEDMLKKRREDYPDDKQDIIVKRFKHNDLAINALMYNTSDEAALVAAQLSRAEGCETRISDWIKHGVPVIVAKIGGMPFQIIPGESGLVVDLGENRDTIEDMEAAAEWVSELLVDPAKYKAMVESTLAAAKRHNLRNYVTTTNGTRILRAIHTVLTGGPIDKRWEIDNLLEQGAPQEKIAA